MLNKFDVWKYSDSRNCWDFVREFLIECAGVPACDVPKFGICPSDKREMTRASLAVNRNFIESEPAQYAVACHYIGRLLVHVGIVVNERVIHVGKKTGRLSDTIQGFERRGQRTEYRIHKSLCQS